MKKNVLHRANLFFRSLAFSIFMSTGIALYSFICVLSLVLPLRIRYAMVAFWTRVNIQVLKLTCNIDYTVEGAENIPQDRAGIVLSKHQSTWETFFLPSYFREAAIIIKRELYWVPFFGWGLLAVEPIAINRSDKSSAMEQVIKKGRACLAKGRWVLLFPEGTRVAPGKVGNYRLGGARLAVATDAPIIPVAHNAGRFWPRRKFIKKPGTVRVVFGAPIETKGRTPEDVLAEVKDWIETTMLRIDR